MALRIESLRASQCDSVQPLGQKNMTRHHWLLCAVLLAAGCGGILDGAGDAADFAPDAGPSADGGALPAADVGPDSDDGGQPGADAAPVSDAGETCQDSCPATNGLTWQCRKRFALGTNWAWHQFGADFGGISAWNQRGVSQNASAFQDDLAAMKAKKAVVIRWWMFPRFWSSGIYFSAGDIPKGVGGTLIADVQKGLELAEQADLYLVLTLFSFDNFKPTADESGIHTPGLQPVALDAGKRKELFDNVIAPIAAAVEASPYRKRALAWDMINEPEWAMTGPNPYGNSPFEPQSGLQTVTHSEMVTFLSELAAALRAHSSAQITLGSAAIKWATAWKHLDLDFYQLHYYDWVYEWYPYDAVTLQSQGLTDKPVVMGEFPNAGLSAIPSKNLPARTASQLVSDLLDHGYAGALSWSYTDTSSQWSALDLETFADTHICETRF